MVDGKSLVGLTHDEAVAVLKGTQKLVQLVVASEHIGGESLDSSMQSIPEKLMNHVMMLPETFVVPEYHKSPLRNTFQQDDEYEMKNVSVSTEKFSPGLAFGNLRHDNLKTIEIKRSEGEPLGFSIRQGNPGISTRRLIFVHAIDPHGAAARTNQLHEGDWLLKANEISLENCTREEALDVLTVRFVNHRCILLLTLVSVGIER